MQQNSGTVDPQRGVEPKRRSSCCRRSRITWTLEEENQEENQEENRSCSRPDQDDPPLNPEATDLSSPLLQLMDSHSDDCHICSVSMRRLLLVAPPPRLQHLLRLHEEAPPRGSSFSPAASAPSP
ncbi:hypothetical protein FQA47_018281 [Oryzias melastigma]|uniref:Uncharacterized protein n=1 Tax=Oryzias melastigma TaxID=30732 RepID=A0A834FSM4_ORYME|nr:hypothetical protein FQA47_018281 [Oryzias melastigma]